MTQHLNTPVSSLNNHFKDTKLSQRQQKVHHLLLKGKWTVVQLTIELLLADPRSYIFSLRKKGILVLDEWIKNGDTRCKRYWIEPHKSELL